MFRDKFSLQSISITRDKYFEDLNRVSKLTLPFELIIQDCKEQVKIRCKIPNFYGNFSNFNLTLNLVQCKV